MLPTKKQDELLTQQEIRVPEYDKYSLSNQIKESQNPTEKLK